MPAPRLPIVPPLVPKGATFAFGASPFRAKGVLYQGTQAFFAQRLQGGMDALVAEIAEPELRDFIAQKFLPSGWYDAMPVPALIAYEARALRMSLHDYLLHRSRYQAKRDLGGVYGWILRLASPRLVAARLPRVMTQMFDFATIEDSVDEPGKVEARFHGIPAPLEEWLHTGVAVYSETAMKLAGARAVRVAPPTSEVTGDTQGVAVTTMTYSVTWE